MASSTGNGESMSDAMISGTGGGVPLPDDICDDGAFGDAGDFPAKSAAASAAVAGDFTETTADAASFLSGLQPIQRKILDYLLSSGGSSTDAGLGAAFPGVFVGVEMDRINDYAIERIGDLLIGFEDDRWYIMEEYIGDI